MTRRYIIIVYDQGNTTVLPFFGKPLHWPPRPSMFLIFVGSSEPAGPSYRPFGDDPW
jgi:hypothetical protein